MKAESINTGELYISLFFSIFLCKYGLCRVRVPYQPIAHQGKSPSMKHPSKHVKSEIMVILVCSSLTRGRCFRHHGYHANRKQRSLLEPNLTLQRLEASLRTCIETGICHDRSFVLTILYM